MTQLSIQDDNITTIFDSLKQLHSNGPSVEHSPGQAYNKRFKCYLIAEVSLFILLMLTWLIHRYVEPWPILPYAAVTLFILMNLLVVCAPIGEAWINRITIKRFKCYLIAEVSLFILFMLTCLIHEYVGPWPILSYAAAILLILISILVVCAPIGEAWINRITITDFFRFPFQGFYQKASRVAQGNAQCLDDLHSKSLDSLLWVKCHLNHQYDTYRHRMAVVVGPIEKFSFFIGIIAMIGLFSPLYIYVSWLTPVAFTIILLHVFSVVTQVTLHRVKLNLDILQYVIDQKTAQKSD